MFKTLSFHRIPSILAVGVLSLGLGACSTPAQKDYNPEVDFSRYQQLNYLPEDKAPNPAIISFKNQHPLLAQRVKTAIQNSLQTKGIGVEKDPANGYISYHLETEKYLVQDPVTFHVGVGTFGRHGGLMFGGSEPLIEEQEYRLVIDIYNPLYEVVWRGKAEFDPDLADTPQESEQQIQALVDKILLNFPPKPQ
ncbi:DUF4136 domain-containing protein [Thiomicrorhabdus sp. 6S3-12]|uniref:DUF4136 domain-containing protein n=1 Tax=Thiomicrorhabdus sp. 6S3-12 TaxID=2819681 RepID=UPI001AADD3F7|nr:DUF4136 domain-containing protein [Thiomicrorhabdus sp. 6S3-12]MBO1925073.1 DUF4136 domain-containing protein [Thiomicrorhabdus sp. 6S3-12]